MSGRSVLEGLLVVQGGREYVAVQLPAIKHLGVVQDNLGVGLGKFKVQGGREHVAVQLPAVKHLGVGQDQLGVSLV